MTHLEFGFPRSLFMIHHYRLEAIQTILRREGYQNPYEKIKELTRNNKKITKNDLLVFINRLDVSKQIKKELKNISPKNYTGI